MAIRHNKYRTTIDLAPELKDWLDKAVLKLSYDRGVKVSRNQLIEEALIAFKEHLESEQK